MAPKTEPREQTRPAWGPSPPANGRPGAGPRKSVVPAAVPRWPFLTFFGICLLCNAVGSAFNIAYNHFLIFEHYLDDGQLRALSVVIVAYNLVAYPAGLGILIYLLWPLSACLGDLRAGRPVGLGRLVRCRLLLVNLPFYQVTLNFLCWAPGAVLFPLGICLLGGWNNAVPIWEHFAVSFLVSALMTTVQAGFLLEAFLVRVVYPEFFHDARPASIPGAVRIPLGVRLLLYWAAVAVVPLVALLAVALNFTSDRLNQFDDLRLLALGVAGAGVGGSAVLALLVNYNLVSWVEAHEAATEQITLGNYEYTIRDKRPDEFGLLTERFNDMAAELGQGRRVRDAFGQFVHPDVRDEIVANNPGMGGEVRDVTVLFLDIRGFTRRSAGEAPERVVGLLNRFLSAAVAAVEGNKGWVNKFLGDGLMAMFGSPRPCERHADYAVRAALDLLGRLRVLNDELAAEGQAPIAVGVGIHTGPALVGCVGATMTDANGRPHMRREFTAIGETVNLASRVEQLTKKCGGPVLITEQTRAGLKDDVPLTALGPQDIYGYDGQLTIYRVERSA